MTTPCNNYSIVAISRWMSLMEATRDGNVNTVELLLNANSELHLNPPTPAEFQAYDMNHGRQVPDWMQQAPLQYAWKFISIPHNNITSNHARIIQLFIRNIPKWSISIQLWYSQGDVPGESPLIILSRTVRDVVFQLLRMVLCNGGSPLVISPPRSIDTSFYTITPIHTAVRLSNDEGLIIMIENARARTFNDFLPKKFFSEGITTLIGEYEGGQTADTRRLVNWSDPTVTYSQTPLYSAIFIPDSSEPFNKIRALRCVRILLAYGADPQTVVQGRLGLHTIAEHVQNAVPFVSESEPECFPWTTADKAELLQLFSSTGIAQETKTDA